MASVGASINEVAAAQFRVNVLHLSQQRSSRLLPYVQTESIKGESAFFDRIGQTAMVRKYGRNQDVIEQDATFSRRMLTVIPWYWAKYTDDFDKIQNIHDPESEYSRAAEMALARRIDITNIVGILGTAYAGKRGATAVELPATQKLAATSGIASVVHSKLSLSALRAARQLLWENEALMDDGQMIPFVTTGENIMALLQDPNITSADYNTVKSLVNGEIDSFMGFKFIRIEFLPVNTGGAGNYNNEAGNATVVTATATRNFCFVPECIKFGLGNQPKSKIAEIPQKLDSTLVTLQAYVGSMRMEEVKVVEVLTAA